MEIKIQRKETNKAYTSGTLSANGKTVAQYILEYTQCMLPPGTYQLTMLTDTVAMHRQLAVVAEDHDTVNAQPHVMAVVMSGNSYRNVMNTPNVVIGEKLIPGAVINSRKVFERFFDRMEKCVARGESITLCIDGNNVREHKVPTFWLTPRNKGGN